MLPNPTALRRFLFFVAAGLLLTLAGIPSLHAAVSGTTPIAAPPTGIATLLPAPVKGQAQAPVANPLTVDGRVRKVWTSDEKSGALAFVAPTPFAVPTSGTLYLKITYVDTGYGRITVQVATQADRNRKPDRFLGLSRMDTKKLVTARLRLTEITASSAPADGVAPIRIGLERWVGEQLQIESVVLQDKPFTDDPLFTTLLTDPWIGPYTGPTVAAIGNGTLKGKVMVGYQGWFRTPNDLEGGGWFHWGDIQGGRFNTDMWPDTTQYPSRVLTKAADVKTLKGKQGYLFSSTWPEVTNVHFRWMRENSIDGVFLQRFMTSGVYWRQGKPEWVLANVRAAANREGRLWAIEYDVSGFADDKLLEGMRQDWAWMIDTFQLKKDPNYLRENGKPVVFIWGLPFKDRNFTPATADTVVDFFKNDPKYGGNYVIGGIPGNWRTGLSAEWKQHITHYAAIQPWMSTGYAEDLAEAKRIGVTYLGHVKPGFSWANMMHITTGDTAAYTPREAGKFYWNSLTAAAKAGVDRLCVGMFDEYDESTAIMPMSDDPPATPSRPGVATRFSRNGDFEGSHNKRVLPTAEFVFDGKAPGDKVPAEDYQVTMSGQIICPLAADYTFIIQGVPDDGVTLRINGAKVIETKKIAGDLVAKNPIKATPAVPLTFRIDYRHGSGTGAFRLLWSTAAMARTPVPADALRDAWGRFLTNEGKPSDYWLKLTKAGREMLNGKRPLDGPMP